MNREDEIRMLKLQMDSLENSRKAMEKRLDELGKEELTRLQSVIFYSGADTWVNITPAY